MSWKSDDTGTVTDGEINSDWEHVVSGSAGNADAILDEGAEGLKYFEYYLPLYRQCLEKYGHGNAAIAGREYYTLCGLYDAERGMDIEALERMSKTLTSTLPKLSTELQTQQTQRTSIQSVWQGDAGDAAFTMLNEQVRRADADYNNAIVAGRELGELANALRNIIAEKATDVRGYWRPAGTADFELKGRDEPFLIGTIENCIEYADTVDYQMTFLRDVFAPQVESTVLHFEEVCKETSRVVREVFNQATTALAAVEAAPYPAPEDAPTPDTSQKGDPTTDTSSGGGTPSSGGTTTGGGDSAGETPETAAAGATKTATTDDGSSTNSSTDLSGLLSTVSSGLTTLSSVVSELSSLTSGSTSSAESIAASIGTGLSSLGASITNGVEQLNGLFSGNGATEVTIAGTTLSLATDDNGQLTLTTTDSAGTAHEYGLTLNENGIPVISDSAATPEPAPAAPGGANAAPEPDPATPSESTTEVVTGEETVAPEVSAVQPGTPVTNHSQTPDSEHRPTTPEPEAPSDTGAELAEAGPL
ncbi:hypothetical protein ACFO5K_25865 [Nocardia halotolerans]|uniref:Proteins of 100 residues with WXG n=1 Tax=Nocardia halotolerans TaxID=1755878 RepID=A0ABV8VQ53_9NOCA